MARPIMPTEKGVCYICGFYDDTELHHIYPGDPRRRLSTEDGMMVYLCRSCHRAVHGNRVDKLRELQRDGQRVWESTYGSREDFIRRYGKSYILDEDGKRRKTDGDI